ncbi:MAG: hypothetical protein HDT32_00855 [Clostridiales bacterium]|nr:hypothetical protein [Clostridiales bacterium]
MLTLEQINQIEQIIGYVFKNKYLLQQAFIRKSYSSENGGQDNEVIELIGDNALGLAVVRIMMKKFGMITEDEERSPRYFQTKYGEGKFTDIKKDLVNKKALSKAMDSLGFHNYLIMGKGDIKQKRQNDRSVKEDLFEAIIGAVTLDCDWDMDVITCVVKNMIDFDAHFNNDLDKNQNYVGAVQEFYQANRMGLPSYQYMSGFDCAIGESTKNTYNRGEGPVKCQLVSGNIHYNGYGYSNAEAKEKCAECFLCGLINNNTYALELIIAAIGEPDENEAIRQLNELSQKKLISKPIYTFEQEYDDSNNIQWKCTCLVEECRRRYSNYASSKKEAQRLSAYDALLDLTE